MDTNYKSADPFMESGGTTPFERESWKALLQRVYDDTTRLMDKEGQLIRTEMNEKLADVKTASASLLLGGVFLLVGFFSLAASAIILLDLIAPLWIAAVIVSASFLLIGAVILATAKKKFNSNNLKPKRSIAAFREIRTSLKEKVNEITKH